MSGGAPFTNRRRVSRIRNWLLKSIEYSRNRAHNRDHNCPKRDLATAKSNQDILRRVERREALNPFVFFERLFR
jgi:hypothetical protein